jgi:hypothetical protein
LPHSDIHGSKPARGSPWLFAACHVLHRLLVPRHPPNALLLLEVIGTPPQGRALHHARKPSTDTDRQNRQSSDHQSNPAIRRLRLTADHSLSTQQRSISRIRLPRSSARSSQTRPTPGTPTRPTDRSNASEHSPRRHWGRHARITAHTAPGQTCTHATGQTSTKRHNLTAMTPAQAHLARPETHQNLIHLDKEQGSRGQSL